ncbi:MAG: Gfo/Idh/MocA family oxidoreductase [candidate division NC10 bacterium]|nr:Gfo/Idh/MocA family oxidoreductase [candidate division NC10 bacterium]
MSRIRVGVIGCGLIGQMMHLPHLKELHEVYEVVALCDVSPGTLRHVGEYYGIGKRYLEYRDLLREPMDAVVVLSADSHGQVIIDALHAGKHVCTEKPMCYTLREADGILAAHRKAGTVCMVTYMKRYDPGFRHARPLIQGMTDLQTIQITVLHPNEANQAGHHDIRRFTDVPPNVQAKLRADQDALIREAIGDFTPLERRVFAGNLLSTLVHDINLLRGLSGDPEEVLFTDVWHGGEGTLTSLRYASGVRAVLSLQYLPDLAHYEETVVYYGKASRVRLAFPSPFFRNMPTPVFVEGMEDGKPFEKKITASLKEAFKEELLHFAECVNLGKTPLTTPEEAKGDVALLHKIFQALKRPVA